MQNFKSRKLNLKTQLIKWSHRCLGFVLKNKKFKNQNGVIGQSNPMNIFSHWWWIIKEGVVQKRKEKEERERKVNNESFLFELNICK